MEALGWGTKIVEVEMEDHRVWDTGAENEAWMCWGRMEVGGDGSRMEDWEAWSRETRALDP